MINQCVFFDRMMTCDECDEFNLQGCGGVAVGWSIRLACGRLGVRIPAATKTSSDSSNAKCLAPGVSVTGPRR